MADLFAGCDSGDEDNGDSLRTNNVYARKYDEWRRKEELMKAKARYGSDLEASSGSDSSDPETEDEEANQWTPQHEKKFLATLSALKGRDPKIYNKNEVIFGDVQNIGDEGNSQENIDGAKVLAKGSKEKQPSGEGKAKMTLKDYERKIIAEEGGVYADEEDDAEPRSRLFDETEQDKLAYDDEQRALRDSLKAAAWGEDADSGNEGDAGGLVTRKERRKDEEVEETEDYIKWLKGETDRLSNKKEAKELASLKKLWSESGEDKLDEAEKFLRDYVLNKRYLTAKENDFKFDVDFSEDEKDVEEMSEFEHKYNFRFEDPDPEFIKRYPRTIEDSMRRKDSRRADKKAEKKARKEQERAQLREQVNRLKSMKKKEILDKIDKLKSITGSEDIAFDDADIEGDFDPEEHDRRMAALFASYDEQAGEDLYPELGEDEKDIEDLHWENWDELAMDQAGGEIHIEGNEIEGHSNARRSKDTDTEAVTDSADTRDAAKDTESESESDSGEDGNESSQQQEDIEMEEDGAGDGIERTHEGKVLVRGKKSAKLTLEDILPQKKEKKRKKSKFAEVLSKKKPTYDPERDRNFEKYFDEYYKLDFEDVVGGVQTRFKYRQVVPNDFGLSTEEVLVAQDKELNKWCTLKKMVQFRSEEEEKKDLQVFSKRKDHLHLKKKILTSVYTTDAEKPDTEIIEAATAAGTLVDVKPKSKSRKNKKKKPRSLEDVDTSQETAKVTEDEKLGDETSFNVQRMEERGNRKRKESEQEYASETGNAEPKRKKRKATGNSGNQKIIHDDKRLSDHDGGKARLTKGKQQNDRKTNQKKTFDGTLQKEKRDQKVNTSKNIDVAEKDAVEAGREDAKSTKTRHSDAEKPEAIPWGQLTAKQKKNRRNALLKKRKKAQVKEQRVEKITKRKEKFRPLEDLQMSEARMKAYGLNPNRMKGSLVYAKNAPQKKKA